MIPNPTLILLQIPPVDMVFDLPSSGNGGRKQVDIVGTIGFIFDYG